MQKALKIHTSHLKFCHTSRGGQKPAQEKWPKVVVKYDKSTSSTPMGLFFEPDLMKATEYLINLLTETSVVNGNVQFGT